MFSRTKPDKKEHSELGESLLTDMKQMTPPPSSPPPPSLQFQTRRYWWLARLWIPKHVTDSLLLAGSFLLVPSNSLETDGRWDGINRRPGCDLAQTLSSSEGSSHSLFYISEQSCGQLLHLYLWKQTLLLPPISSQLPELWLLSCCCPNVSAGPLLANEANQHIVFRKPLAPIYRYTKRTKDTTTFSKREAKPLPLVRLQSLHIFTVYGLIKVWMCAG